MLATTIGIELRRRASAPEMRHVLARKALIRHLVGSAFFEDGITPLAGLDNRKPLQPLPRTALTVAMSVEVRDHAGRHVAVLMKRSA